MANAVRRDVEPVLPGVEDVAQAQEAARALANELTRQAQELGLGY